MTRSRSTTRTCNILALAIVFSVAVEFAPGSPGNTKSLSATQEPLFAGSDVPAPLRSVLQRACQDCHSQNTDWPWYANLPPISSQIHNDVTRGRAFMDFSKWNDYTEAQRRGYRLAIVAAVQENLMPPPKYVWMHSQARLSAVELKLLKEWQIAERKPSSASRASHP